MGVQIETRRRGVSIPYLSGHPFLRRRSRQQGNRRRSCVNPLSIGTPISTDHPSMGRKSTHNPVSIPYLSGHPFLRSRVERMSRVPDCVNPLSIGTPISTLKNRRYKMYDMMCQSPIYRDTHFYAPTPDPASAPDQECVNPLSIGTPISTCSRKSNG